MDVLFRNVKELVALCEKENKRISDVMIEQEMQISGRTYEAIFTQMERNLSVMEEAVERGLKGVQSVTGLTGGDAVLIQNYIASGKSLSGDILLDGYSAYSDSQMQELHAIACKNIPHAILRGV